MKASPHIRFVGIRHHGPGCARHLKALLELERPDKILIEGPDNAQLLLENSDITNFELPVAVLLYKEGDAKHTYILPFAEFSPEWVAIKFAKENAIPVEFMDLPLGVSVNYAQQKSADETNDFPIKNTYDAFEYLADIQGIQDVEQWWEINFERVQDLNDYFNKIEEIIYSIKPAIDQGSTHHTKVREAWMRQKIRKVQKEEFRNVLVISGAAHLPYLKEFRSYKAADDKILTKLKSKNALATNWIPWSYTRLSSLNEYSAGVEFPLFYEHIFRYGSSAPITITAALSVYMRTKGYDISLAHTLEAVNLSQTLATIRGFDIPGIDIILESCTAVYNLESKIPLKGLIREAFVGNTHGSVPIDLNQQALIEDFRLEVKNYKLQKYTIDNSEYEVVLDLRNEKSLSASRLIWRLKLLGIEWGQISDPFKSTKGTFNEYWILQWHAEYLILLFHQCIYGSTIEMAAVHKTKEIISLKSDPKQLSDLITPILNAQIPELTDFYLNQLANIVFRQSELKDWMVLIPRLITHCKYGSVRDLDLTQVRSLIASITDKICVNLQTLLTETPEESLDELNEIIRKFHNALISLKDESITATWMSTIFELAAQYLIPPIIRGWMTGVCLEKGMIDGEEAYSRMSYELSDLDNINGASQWLQGILSTQVFSVFEVPKIISIVNSWLELISFDQFRDILPGLRKSFSGMNIKLKESFRMFSQKTALPSVYSNEAHIDNRLKNIMSDYLISFNPS